MSPTNREGEVSAYLRTPPRPMPQWLGGERIRFPGDFGFSVAARPVWSDQLGDWIYSWISDEERKAA